MLAQVAGYLRTQKTLGRWALYCIPDVHRTIRVHPIGPFCIRLRRDRRFWVRHPLHHERFNLGALARLARHGDVVYDVGANIGLYARFFTQVFHASKVVAFEPMAANRQTLLQNLALAVEGSRVQVLPLALADHQGEELLQADDIASGAAVLDSVTGGAPSESHRQYGMAPRTERVAVTDLDSLVAREALPPPSLMKIDVEGAEAMVLRGARRTLAAHKPRLAIELHGPDTARAVLPMLHELGYAVAAHGYRRGQHWFGPAGPDDAAQETEPYGFHFVFAAESAEIFQPPFQPLPD